jgi:hypothetical protein
LIERINGIDLVLGTATSPSECGFTQVVLRIDEARLGMTKAAFKDALIERGVPVWHANFELINSLSLFRGEAWEPWQVAADLARLRANYRGNYPVAERVCAEGGLGLGKMNFLSPSNLRHLVKQIERLCMGRTR